MAKWTSWQADRWEQSHDGREEGKAQRRTEKEKERDLLGTLGNRERTGGGEQPFICCSHLTEAGNSSW